MQRWKIKLNDLHYLMVIFPYLKLYYNFINDALYIEQTLTSISHELALDHLKCFLNFNKKLQIIDYNGYSARWLSSLTLGESKSRIAGVVRLVESKSRITGVICGNGTPEG